MVDDKDINAVLNLLPKDAEYYFCQASTHRAIAAERVAELAKSKGLDGKTFISVADAYKSAMSDSADEDLIFIGGSSYVVADLLTFLKD